MMGLVLFLAGTRDRESTGCRDREERLSRLFSPDRHLDLRPTTHFHKHLGRGSEGGMVTRHRSLHREAATLLPPAARRTPPLETHARIHLGGPGRIFFPWTKSRLGNLGSALGGPSRP
jgi:hypothetical protein